MTSSTVDSFATGNADKWNYLRESKIGSLVAIENVQTGLEEWATTRPRLAGPVGEQRGAGHRLDHVAVDGASYFIEHDTSGRITTAPDYNLAYDEHGRLIAAYSGPLNVETYAYDALGQIAAVFDGSANLKHHYVYDGPQIISAFDGNGALEWEAVWGQQIDQLYAFRDVANNSGQLVPLADHRNSIVGTFSTALQNIDQIAEYDPHGRVTLRNSDETVVCQEAGNAGIRCDAPSGLPFGFASALRSDVTGLVYMRNRWYSPRLGQFITHDSLGYIDAHNPYAYVAFDPINFLDPWGLNKEGGLAEVVKGANEGFYEIGNAFLNEFGPCMAMGILSTHCAAYKVGKNALNEGKKGKTPLEKAERAINTINPMVPIIIETEKAIHAANEGRLRDAGNSGAKATINALLLSQVLAGVKGVGVKKPKCFQVGTLIDTPEGKTRIEDIQVGDLVWAFDFESNERVAKNVKSLIRGSTTSWVHIRTNDGSELVATTSHKFWVESEGIWLNAEDLLPEMIFRTSEGGTARIITLYIEELEFAEQTYNFEVAEEHNYFVGKRAILVHNEHPKILGTKLSGASAHEAAKVIQIGQAKKLSAAVNKGVGGMYRLDFPAADVDITLKGNQPHVHGKDSSGREWSRNIDGSIHDSKKTGKPSKKAMKAMKAAGWGNGGC